MNDEKEWKESALGDGKTSAPHTGEAMEELLLALRSGVMSFLAQLVEIVKCIIQAGGPRKQFD